MLANEVHM